MKSHHNRPRQEKKSKRPTSSTAQAVSLRARPFYQASNFIAMRKLLFLFLPVFLCLPQNLPAQQERPVDFSVREEGNALRFIPQAPPLQQMAGAPPAYWQYFWEFGDGSFSFEEQPLHAYPDGGEYEVILALTATYDHGKPPKEKPKKVRGNNSSWASNQAVPNVLPKPKDAIALQAVRNPRPEESFLLILSYHNPTNRTIDGQITVNYNETAFGYELFTFREARTHYGETPAQGLSLLLPENGLENAYAYAYTGKELPFGKREPSNRISATAYRNNSSTFGQSEGWYFQNLAPGETRNLFMSFDASPQMLQDTNVIIHFQARLQDAGGQLDETFDLALSIVSSHDPNYLAVDKRLRSYRGISKKKFKYEVHFQNNGDGPANKIRISINLPEGLNPESLEVMEYYPECPICPKGQPITSSCLDTTLYKNRVEFTFHNIYLPGTKQEGVSKRDSTKGFVRYALKPGKKTEKRKMKSRASIFFDNDAPIITRPANTRFKWGISPAVVLSRPFYPDTITQWRLGFTAAPFKPYRPYLQMEIHGSTGLKVKKVEQQMDTTSFTISGQGFQIDSIYTTQKNISSSRFSMEFVPLHLRHNLGGFLALGAGVSVEWAQEVHDVVALRSLTEVCETGSAGGVFCFTDVQPGTSSETYRTSSQYFAPSLFAELSLGRVRIGPSAGLRAYLPLSDKRKFYLSIFGTWRF